MGTVRVQTGAPYDVTVGHGAAAGLPSVLDAYRQVAVIYPVSLADYADRWTRDAQSDVFLVGIPDGEQAKDEEVLLGCWRALAANGFTRSDAVVGLGGGATTDLAGFVAATYVRGVAYYSVPTTALAMVDAAVGGKTGIDLPEGKNLVGAFWEPRAVIADLDALATLPAAELRGGFGEIVKHGFIADPETLALIERHGAAVLDPASPVLAELIERSVAVKAGVVAGDLRERTSQGRDVGRELLNYGHTLAHAIEKVERFSWNHGEAVSVGMMFAASLSRELGHADDALVERHRAILTSLGLPVSYRPGAWDDLRATMRLDKKSRGADLRFVLLDAVASPFIAASPAEDALRAAYDAISA